MTLDGILDVLVMFFPLISTTAIVGALLWGTSWLLLDRHPEMGIERKFPRQFAMLVLTLVGALAIVLALPVDASTRNQIIGLVGLLLSGVVAFSSSNLVANLMAGLVLRITQPFRTGDYVRVDAQFGRVTERGLMDTEIQTETRELVSLPNTYLVSNPVCVVRSSGTIVSATISLGYDVHHSQVESLLVAAARACDLDSPFVHILELGNYAITYRVNGLLLDVNALLTTRSNLNRAVLNALHNGGIEIVSPMFMNQRQLSAQTRIIPAPMQEAPSPKPPLAEEIAFDKAEQAARQEKERHALENEIGELEAQLKTAEGADKQRISDAIEQTRARLTERTEQVNGEDTERSRPA